ncbi:MAG: lysylphosphatidylglycerol synthase transmembrane domain-containing protein [Rhodothermales bacterium]
MVPAPDPNASRPESGEDPSVPAVATESAGRGRISARSIAWPLLLSLATLGAVGYFTFDLDSFAAIARGFNPWFLAGAVGTVVVRVYFGGWRLSYFSRGRLDMRASVRSQIAWDFFAYVTPSTVGGGPFVSVFMARDRGLPLGEATSIILFAMLIDQLCLALTIPVLVVCAAYVDVFPASLGTVGAWSLALVFLGYMAWVLVFAYGTLVRPQLLTGLVGGVLRIRWLRRFRTRGLRVLSDLQTRSAVLRAQPLSFYAKGFGLTLVPWISRYLLAVFVIRSVYSATDELLIFLRSAALQLGALAMPTPGGAGGVEGLYVLFFGPDLLPPSLVAPTLLVWRLLSYYVFIFAGLFITMRHVQQRVT